MESPVPLPEEELNGIGKDNMEVEEEEEYKKDIAGLSSESLQNNVPEPAPPICHVSFGCCTAVSIMSSTKNCVFPSNN